MSQSWAGSPACRPDDGTRTFEERDAEVPRVADEVLKSVRECQALRSRGDTQSLSCVLHWLERMDDALRGVYESLDAFRPRRVVPCASREGPYMAPLDGVMASS